MNWIEPIKEYFISHIASSYTFISFLSIYNWVYWSNKTISNLSYCYYLSKIKIKSDIRIIIIDTHRKQGYKTISIKKNILLHSVPFLIIQNSKLIFAVIYRSIIIHIIFHYKQFNFLANATSLWKQLVSPHYITILIILT